MDNENRRLIEMHWEKVETKVVPSKKDGGSDGKIIVRKNVATGDTVDHSDTDTSCALLKWKRICSV